MISAGRGLNEFSDDGKELMKRKNLKTFEGTDNKAKSLRRTEQVKFRAKE